METVSVLAVSRDADTVGMLRSLADSHSWEILHAVSAWEAMDSLKNGLRPNLLLLDQPQGDVDTLQIMRCLRSVIPDLSAVVICHRNDIGRDRMVQEPGMQELLVRPLDEHMLDLALSRQLAPKPLQSDFRRSADVEVFPAPFFLNAGLASQKIFDQARLLAEADVPVLITGERGSGKRTVAKLIHLLSDRSGSEFLAANCAGAPSIALEAELFGNDLTAHPGKIERAEKGTILIDEITELPLALQKKVMHLLQDKLRVTENGRSAVSANVRILATTSDDIDKAEIEGKLREDLYYRLSAFTIQIPPLRQRRDEIPSLLNHLMNRLADDFGLPARSFPPAVIEACLRHSWPANVHELESFVKRYLLTGNLDLGLESDTRLTHVQRGQTANVDVDRPSPKPLKTLVRSLQWEAERNAIRTALDNTGWNRKAAARLLQVSYRTLLYKISQYGMRAPQQPLFAGSASKLTLMEPEPKSFRQDNLEFEEETPEDKLG